MFDLVIIGLGVNPSKNNGSSVQSRLNDLRKALPFYHVHQFENVFNLYHELQLKYPGSSITIVRGIRDYRDLEPEYLQVLQDRGINSTLIKTPANLAHISSRAIRELTHIGESFHKKWILPAKNVTGVTGKICSGKSSFMQKLPTSAAHLNVDELTKCIIGNFLDGSGSTIDLKAVKVLAFKDPNYMKVLVALTKDKVEKDLRTIILRDSRTQIYVEDAMMMEYNRTAPYDNFIFISAVDEDLITRLMKRNNITRQEAEHRLSFFENTNPFKLPEGKVSIVNTSINP
jgi:dephospho-CoA kinase/phosphopantetheine adenylyltransferase